jgi:hypothetical protein
MTTADASVLGRNLAKLIEGGLMEEAGVLLAPVLAGRTPFRLLDRMGTEFGGGSAPAVYRFLGEIAAGKTEGGWAVIGGALRQQLSQDRARALEACRTYVIAADVWYATDILGERVPGPALVEDLEPALELLAPWRSDPNSWIRRTVGVAIHFWTKRSRGKAEWHERVHTLLDFLEPMFEERDINAVKGVGWSLKTMGRYYPGLLTPWLVRQVSRRPRHRALMVRKATKFLSAGQRSQVAGAT